jgi:PAS domain S-box-containing protein
MGQVQTQIRLEGKAQQTRDSASTSATQPGQEHDWHGHLEALVDGQSQVLEMISQGLPLTAILEAMTYWVEAQSRDGVLVSLLLLDRDGQHLLHGAAPSLPEAYNSTIHGIQIGPMVGSCGTAAFTKHAVIVEDIAHDPLWANYRDLALAHGLRACWSTPLIARDGRVLGTFAMYYRHPRQPTADDMHLIRLVTRTAILAIEHKQAEEEREQLLLREQQALQRAENKRQHLYEPLMETPVMETPAALALLRGPRHVFELANPLYRQAIGAGRDVLGKPIRMALPELEGQRFFELLDQVYASGEPYAGKETLVQLNRNGAVEDAYFDFVYQPVRDTTGTVDGILVHALDVTDSVRARRQLEESEERYRTLFRSVLVAVYSCDANGVIQAFNQRAVELWGRTPTAGDRAERYCGSLKRFYPDGRMMPRREYPIARVLRGTAVDEADAEFLVERPDGTRRHVVAHPQPLKNERGEIIGAVSCLYDITERKQAEATAAYLAAIVSSSSDAIASKTLEGIITSWNASAEQMFGYRAEEIIGQPVLRLIPPARREEEERILARLKAGERIEHFETVRVTKDGRLLEVSLTISPIRDSAGTIIGASKIVRDITERKQLERQRAELLGIVAHDLGNPLAAMKAKVQLLERQLARGRAPETSALHSLGEMVARMERLVRDLRDAESLEGGQLVLVHDHFDLTQLCRQEAETAQAASGRTVVLAVPEGAEEVEADRDRIGQVIANLLLERSQVFTCRPPCRAQSHARAIP